MSKLSRVKELLGVGEDTSRSELSQHHREIIEKVKEESEESSSGDGVGGGDVHGIGNTTNHE